MKSSANHANAHSNLFQSFWLYEDGKTIWGMNIARNGLTAIPVTAKIAESLKTRTQAVKDRYFRSKNK